MADVYDDAPPTATKHGDVPENTEKGDTVVASAVTINRPSGELFDFWRDFGNLSGVLENVERIDVHNSRESHWVVKAPGGRTVEWDAEVTEEQPGTLIAWRSREGGDVDNSGRVTFHDAGERGTVVTATIAYDPPGGTIGRIVAKVMQREPAIQARRDLRRFKQLMETGEIATSAMNPAQAKAENN
jgi:uncharacterized membrane protein